MSELSRLELERHRLVAARDSAIQEINRTFDAAVIPLSRAINRLRKEQCESSESTPAVKKRRQESAPNFDGLTEQEIEHYNELLERQR